jgi:D-glycero-D-manno-heptose 1,7-bisphosphate phosphatase
VFLDRDGVLNEDRGYVHTWEAFVWTDHAREAVKLMNDAGYLVLVVTNQSGIGRGYYTEEDFLCLTSRMQGELARAGAHLDGVYFCPHHPVAAQGAFRRACRCRKPGPGMVERALSEWEILMEASFVIGDSDGDMALAAAVGLPGHRFTGGNLLAFVEPLVQGPSGSGHGGFMENSGCTRE